MTKSYNLSEILPVLTDHGMRHERELAQSKSTIVQQSAFRHAGDLQRHLLQVLFHPDTKSFSGQNNRDFFYNQQLRTFIMINPNKNAEGKICGGTVFRSITSNRVEKYYLINSLKGEEKRLGKPPIEHQKGGIMALRPEVAREFAKEYLQQMGKDVSMGQKDNPQPHGQGKPVTAGDKDQTKERLVSVKGQGQNQASQPGKTPISKPIELEQKKQPVRQRTK